MHQLQAHQPKVWQAAHILDAPSPALLELVRHLQALGVPVLQPGGDLSPALLFEIHRSEGIVLACIQGSEFPRAADDPAEASVAEFNRRKDAAEREGAVVELSALEEAERAHLARRFEPMQNELKSQALFRSPRLQRILVACMDGSSFAIQALHQELLDREAPLLTQACRVYIDLRSLWWAAEDLGRERKDYQLIAIAPREFYRQAASHNLALAIGTYRDRATPVYATIGHGHLDLLSRGLQPTIAGGVQHVDLSPKGVN